MVNFIKIGLLLVLICWTTDSTCAAFSLEEEFLQLKENYIQTKEMMKNLKSKVIELEVKNVQMQEKVTELEEKVQHQDSLLTSLLREKHERTAATDSEFAPMNQSAVAINGLPSSCGDLKMIGHIWSGFYSIMGPAMIESVYCDFTKPPNDARFQKWIGYVDVKSAPVHFYVQRNGSTTTYGKIPWDVAVVNEGNAMDLSYGIFTAPRPGTYFFSFTGVLACSANPTYCSLKVGLYLNDLRISSAVASYAKSTLTLQSTLNLQKGDQVWVQIDDIQKFIGFLDDSSDSHHTHFTGFMLEEEIIMSL